MNSTKKKATKKKTTKKKATKKKTTKKKATKKKAKTYDFVIMQTEHYSGRSDRPLLYVCDVPHDKVDTSDYDKYKKTHKHPKRFLKLKLEFMDELGYPHCSVFCSEWLPKGVPESVQIAANYNPHTGELTPEHELPLIVCA
jgi:hypothetical protein